MWMVPDNSVQFCNLLTQVDFWIRVRSFTRNLYRISESCLLYICLLWDMLKEPTKYSNIYFELT